MPRVTTKVDTPVDDAMAPRLAAIDRRMYEKHRHKLLVNKPRRKRPYYPLVPGKVVGAVW